MKILLHNLYIGVILLCCSLAAIRGVQKKDYKLIYETSIGKNSVGIKDGSFYKDRYMRLLRKVRASWKDNVKSWNDILQKNTPKEDRKEDLFESLESFQSMSEDQIKKMDQFRKTVSKVNNAIQSAKKELKQGDLSREQVNTKLAELNNTKKQNEKVMGWIDTVQTYLRYVSSRIPYMISRFEDDDMGINALREHMQKYFFDFPLVKKVVKNPGTLVEAADELDYDSSDDESDDDSEDELDEQPSGERELGSAAYIGNISRVQELINQGVNINAQNKDGETPLMRASEGGNLDIVNVLLRSGAQANLIDKDGNTALDRAKNMHSFLQPRMDRKSEASKVMDVVRRLETEGEDSPLDYDSSDDDSDDDSEDEQPSGEKELGSAAYIGNISRVQELINQGVNINAQDENGETPLMQASEGGNLDMVNVLLRNGAQANLIDKYGNTALDIAKNTHIRLLRMGREREGEASKVMNVVRRLEADSSDDDSEDESDDDSEDESDEQPSGERDLISAAYIGNISRVQELINQGVNINAQNKNGETPLMRAAEGGNLDIVNVLLLNGAQANLIDKDGNTALDIAKNTHSSYLTMVDRESEASKVMDVVRRLETDSSDDES